MTMMMFELPRVVDDALEVFKASLEAEGLQADKEQIANALLIDTLARKASEIACFGDIQTRVVPFLFDDHEKMVMADELFETLRSAYMFEVFDDPVQRKKHNEYIMKSHERELERHRQIKERTRKHKEGE